MAPDFELSDRGGRVYRLSEHRGRVVLLSFWATWCRSCQEELQELAELQRLLGPQGLVVLTVSIDRSERTLRRFLRKRPLPFVVLWDRQSRVAFDLYGVVGLPTAFLIDAQGRLLRSIYGPQRWASEKWLRRIRELLKEAGQ
jgi:peroxiredoxin